MDWISFTRSSVSSWLFFFFCRAVGGQWGTSFILGGSSGIYAITFLPYQESQHVSESTLRSSETFPNTKIKVIFFSPLPSHMISKALNLNFTHEKIKQRSLILIIPKAHHFKGMNEQMKGWEFEICFLNQMLNLKQPWYQPILPLIFPIPPFCILLFTLPLALCQLDGHCPGFPLFLPSSGLVLNFPADKHISKCICETSLVVQWLRICASKAGGPARFNSWTGNWDHINPVAQQKSKKKKILMYRSWVQLPQALNP